MVEEDTDGLSVPELDTVYVALRVGDAEGDTVAEVVTESVAVPVMAPDAVFALEPLLDAEAHELLEGVKQAEPLREAVTDAERQRVAVGDSVVVTLPVLEPTLVAEAEGVPESETVPEPHSVPVMLCVIVRDAELLDVIVGDTDKDSVPDSDSVYVAEAEAELDALGLVEAEPEVLGEPRAEGEAEALPEEVPWAVNDGVPDAHAELEGGTVLVGVSVADRQRDVVGVMDSVEEGEPDWTSDGEKDTEGVKEGVVQPDSVPEFDADWERLPVVHTVAVAELVAAADAVGDRVPETDTVSVCVPVLAAVTDVEAEGEPESVAEPVEAPESEGVGELLELSEALPEKVAECEDVAHPV